MAGMGRHRDRLGPSTIEDRPRLWLFGVAVSILVLMASACARPSDGTVRSNEPTPSPITLQLLTIEGSWQQLIADCP